MSSIWTTINIISLTVFWFSIFKVMSSCSLNSWILFIPGNKASWTHRSLLLSKHVYDQTNSLTVVMCWLSFGLSPKFNCPNWPSKEWLLLLPLFYYEISSAECTWAHMALFKAGAAVKSRGTPTYNAIPTITGSELRQPVLGSGSKVGMKIVNQVHLELTC